MPIRNFWESHSPTVMDESDIRTAMQRIRIVVRVLIDNGISPDADIDTLPKADRELVRGTLRAVLTDQQESLYRLMFQPWRPDNPNTSLDRPIQIT